MSNDGQGRFEVFVYGSLMRGLHNHALLERSTFLREAYTQPSFALYSMGYFPAMIRGGQQVVRGELFEVGDATLRALDRLEGHPDFYRRQHILLSDGREVLSYLIDVWTMVTGRPFIEGGCWRSFLLQRQEQMI